MLIIILLLVFISVLLITSTIIWLRKKFAWYKILMMVGAFALVLSIGLIFFVSFNPIEDKLPNKQHFLANYERMMQVVNLIENGKLTPKTNTDISKRLGERIILPKNLRDLSSKGEVIYQKQGDIISILFVTSTDMFGEHYDGYLYRSNGQPPNEEDFYESIGFTEKTTDKWFCKTAI